MRTLPTRQCRSTRDREKEGSGVARERKETSRARTGTTAAQTNRSSLQTKGTPTMRKGCPLLWHQLSWEQSPQNTRCFFYVSEAINQRCVLQVSCVVRNSSSSKRHREERKEKHGTPTRCCPHTHVSRCSNPSRHSMLLGFRRVVPCSFSQK